MLTPYSTQQLLADIGKWRLVHHWTLKAREIKQLLQNRQEEELGRKNAAFCGQIHGNYNFSLCRSSQDISCSTSFFLDGAQLLSPIASSGQMKWLNYSHDQGRSQKKIMSEAIIYVHG